jgi:MFS family permease
MKKDNAALYDKSKDRESRIKPRMWLSYIVIGLIGQIAWVIENMYLNTFIFSFGVGNDYSLYIAITEAASAIVAVITTLLVGSFSDKVGKKKIFIVVGYILWGISTLAFGFIKVDTLETQFAVSALEAAKIASLLVISLDCIMTFFGSSANDACFNAYVTKTTNSKNRGRVEGVLSIFPLIAMLLVFGILNNLTVSTSTTPAHWDIFFYIIGGITFSAGIAAIFLLPKEEKVVDEEHSSFFNNLFYGFKIENIKKNKILYVLLSVYLFYCIATNVFMPYLMIYVQETLQISGIWFSISLGSVLILGAIFSVLFGFIMDKFGKLRALIPSCLIFAVGLLSMFFVGANQVAIFIVVGSIMMAGYMAENGAINANIRDYTPVGEEGSFQGIRMIFQVAIPMCTGPFIGKAIIDSMSTNTYDDAISGTTKLPTPYLFIFASVIALLSIIPIIFALKINRKNDRNNNGILHPNPQNLKECKNPLPEYPRPQFKRNSYVSLNGIWDCEISSENRLPYFYTRKIVVPYAIESELSNISAVLKEGEFIYYHKVFTVDNSFNKGRVFLHFDGVDQIASVYINGALKTIHNSGYTDFKIDITDDISDGCFDIVVKVADYSDLSYFAFGKQRVHRGGIWYTTSSGIYKSVWLESTPKEFIEYVKFTPHIGKGTVGVFAKCNVKGDVIVSGKDFEATIPSNVETEVSIKNPMFWSPESPYLYYATITFKDDVVETYFGMREIKIDKDSNGIRRVFLNNNMIFLNGVLNQAYYYKGNLTPQKDEDMLFDIQKIKDLGFNTIRLHIKVENDRFYYYCDKVGILVIQDFVNGGENYNKLIISAPAIVPLKIKDNKYRLFGRQNVDGRLMFMQNMLLTVDFVYNHPSVIMYTIFNEGWGQFDTRKVYEELLSSDSTRLVDANSGWYDQKCGDFVSKHIYFKKINIKHPDKTRAILLSEFGGYALYLNDSFYGKKPYGYKKFDTNYELSLGYKSLFEKQIFPAIPNGLCGCIYTQFTDIEDEVNGIMTFDRKNMKINESFIKEINSKLNSTKL